MKGFEVEVGLIWFLLIAFGILGYLILYIVPFTYTL